MIDLRSTPEPLKRGQQLAVWVATLVTAVTRVWGLARSPWDWDEMLFSLALRHYDVGIHQPHPPGFPLFIAAARLFRLAGLSDFRSLQAVNLVASVLLVPAMFFFCRELRLKLPTSLIASLFLAFFPNVWFFGETAFSDVPSIVLVVFACGLLLRGCRSDRAYVSGAIVLAIAGAFRPQNLVVGLAPFIIATWFRRKVRLTAVAIISAALILAASYGAAVAESGGWERYRKALLLHQQYVTATDSFRSPIRPPLHRLLDDFFVRPYRAPVINSFVTGFALISVGVSLLRRRVPVLIAIASFSPFCLAAWLFLDHFSASRFSIGFAPLIAVLAADGVVLISFKREGIEWAIGLALTALMFVWTVPAIDLPRRGDSPPVQAAEWLRSHASITKSQIYVHESVGAYAEYFLDRYRVALDGPPIARLDPSPAWYMKEGTSGLPGAINFSWPQGRAAQVTRRRYFDVAVIPLNGVAQFGDGWYDEEAAGESPWRWMGARGTIELPPIAGKARLRLRLFVPLHVMPSPPSITVRLNGAVIESLRPRAPFIDIVHDSDGSAHVLTIETDRVVNPRREKLGEDPRDLGLRLDRLEWIAVER